MAAVARGIGETSGAVQLNGCLGKYFIFVICFLKVQLSLPGYLFVSLFANVHFFILLFFSAENISRF